MSTTTAPEATPAADLGPFVAFLRLAEITGATVRPIGAGNDRPWTIQHNDTTTIEVLHLAARVIGDTGAIFGLNRFIIAPHYQSGF